MKKKLAIVMLACALSASALTACGGSGTEKEAQKTEASDKKDEAKETKEKSADTDYASWTGKEWKAANDEEKAEAAKYCLLETTKATAKAAGTEWTDGMEKSVLTDEAIQAEQTVLEAAFTQDETLKLSDIIEQASAVIDTAVNQAGETEQ